MKNLEKLLICLAALAFVLAVVMVFTGPIADVPAESFSRACNNLAVLAIALAVAWKNGGTASKGGED